MIKRDLVIAVLLTFCLTTVLFMILPTRSQYDPWNDLNDDGVIDSTDLGMMGTGWGTFGDPAKSVNIVSPVDGQGSVNVNITGHATKLIDVYHNYNLTGGSYVQSMIRVDGYSKVSVMIILDQGYAVNNSYAIYADSDTTYQLYYVDSALNFTDSLCRTYDVMNRYIYIFVKNWNPPSYWANLSIQVYLVA